MSWARCRMPISTCQGTNVITLDSSQVDTTPVGRGQVSYHRYFARPRYYYYWSSVSLCCSAAYVARRGRNLTSEKENSGSQKQKKFSVYPTLDGSFQVLLPPCYPVLRQIGCGSHWISRMGRVLKNCRKLSQSFLLSSFLTGFSVSH